MWIVSSFTPAMDDSFSIGSSGAGQRQTQAADCANPNVELTIVVPTLNERDNILPLVEKIDAALAGAAWEVIFVDDDSHDGTADAVRALAGREPRVRCIRRIGRRGLSTACIEGVLASSSRYIAVMDADLQHDERLLPQMLQALKDRTCDVVVGSRYVPGAGVGQWDRGRTMISLLAIRLSQAICRVPLADPMSGFFMTRREVFDDTIGRLSGKGFKLLLDLIASSRSELRVKELPFHFRPRLHGSSKLDTMVAWEFLILLLDKLTGTRLTSNPLLAGCVIACGVAFYLGAQWLARGWGAGPAASASAAMELSAGAIFFLNQLFTYRDQRLAGGRLATRLVIFLGLAGVIALGLSALAGLLNRWSDWPFMVSAIALASAISSYALARVLSRPKRLVPPAGADRLSAPAQQEGYSVSARLRGNPIAPGKTAPANRPRL